MGADGAAAGGHVFTSEQTERLERFRAAAEGLTDVFEPESAWGAAAATIAERVSRTLSTGAPGPKQPHRSVDLIPAP